MEKIIKNQYFLPVISIIVLTLGFFLFYNSNSDRVAIKINDVEFSYSEFQRELNSVVNEYDNYGFEASRDDIIQSVVDRFKERAIIIEKMQELGISASKEEIQTQMNRNVAMFGYETEEEFMDFLLGEGLFKEEIVDAIEYEVKVNKLIEYFAKDFEVTEEDLKERYSLYLSSMGDLEPVPFEEMKEDLKANLIQGFGVQKVFELIDEKKDSLIIEILISDEDIIIEEDEKEKVSAEFINCLKEKGVVIYTSETCPACKDLVDKYGGYDVLSPIAVNCNDDQERCTNEMLEDFVPSVVINGKSFQGLGTPESLATETGCEI